MIKKVLFSCSLILSLLLISPSTGASNSKIIDERHSQEELGEYGDTSKVTLASDRTNLLIKIKEDEFRYTRETYHDKDNFKSYQKDKYKRHNDKFLKRMKIEYDDIYISKYSSYIELSFNSTSTNKLNEAIQKLSSYDFVNKIYIQDDYRPAEKLGGGKSWAGVTPTLISDINQGHNLRIGLLEYGICNTSNANLANSRITCRDEFFVIETTTEHATLMASIIVGSDGIAPQALLYSVQMIGNPVGEIDWLIDNDVTVCNVSIGDGTGSYSSSSRYIDYAASTYGITFCCAVGNDGDENGYVSNMALAYNCIAVGAGTPNSITSYTSTLTPNGQIRPMVTGPSTVVVSNFDDLYHSGTSVATAVCTGVVALIQRYNTELRFNVARVRALLMANATELAYQSFESNDYYDGGGTGMINLQNCINNFNICYEISNSYALNSTGFAYNIIKVLNNGERWRATYSTLVYLDADDNPMLTNYWMEAIDTEERIILETNDFTINDSFEFTTGTATYYCQMSFQVEQSGYKMTSDPEKIYIAFRAAPVNGV